MKLYDLVKELLEKHPQLRSSDKRLIWAVWHRKSLVVGNTEEPRISKIMFMDYMNAPQSESITRARRKVQENHPELAATAEVQHERDKKELTKGTFVYRETVKE